MSQLFDQPMLELGLEMLAGLSLSLPVTRNLEARFIHAQETTKSRPIVNLKLTPEHLLELERALVSFDISSKIHATIAEGDSLDELTLAYRRLAQTLLRKATCSSP